MSIKYSAKQHTFAQLTSKWVALEFDFIHTRH